MIRTYNLDSQVSCCTNAFFKLLLMNQVATELGKRKVGDLKASLSKLGFSIKANARKAELQRKFQQASSILALQNVPPEYLWSRADYNTFMQVLVGQDPEKWDSAVIHLVRSTFHARFFSAEVACDKDCMDMVSKVEERYQMLLTAPIKPKSRIITADSIFSSMKKLIAKPVAKWGDKEGDVLVAMFESVTAIDGSGSSAESIEVYYRLNKLLGTFYNRRPDIKMKVDPEVLTFDLSAALENAAIAAGAPAGANAWLAAVTSRDVNAVSPSAVAAARVIDLYNRSVVAYQGPNFSVEATAAPAVPALPTKSNPGPVPTTFVFTNQKFAQHFLQWMQSRVPGLQATITQSNNAPLIYL